MTTRRRPGAAVAALLLLTTLAACTRQGPDALMASARDYMARSDYSAASIQLRNAVRENPQSAEARLLLGKALLRGNDPLGAESELRRALDLGAPADEVLPPLAQAMLATGQAEALVRGYADRAPADPQARAQFSASLGDAYTVLRRPDDARRAYEAALAAEAGNANARLGLAQLDARAGRLDAALKTTEAVIAADERNARAHALKSDILLSRNDRPGAKRALERAVEADPAYLPGRYAYVSTLIDDGDDEAARTQLADLAKRAPDDARLAYFQSALALRAGDLGAARDRVAQILKAVPDHVPALVLHAKVDLQSRQYASAESHLRRALAQSPDHAEARRLLTSTYLQSGQSAKAQQALQPLLASNAKGDPNVLLLAGEASLASGDAKQATAYFQRVAASGQKTEAALAHTRLGQIAMAAGRPEEGLKELESAASIDPSFRDTDVALVATHLRNGDVDKALAAAKSLEKKNPKDPMAHQVLGMVHIAKKDHAAARASFDKALQLNPSLIPAARALGELDVAEGKVDAARKRYEAMIAKDPRNAMLHLLVAEMLLRTGTPAAQVVPTLRNAVASDPASVEARMALISALARSDDKRAAATAAQEAAAAHPNNMQLLQTLAVLQAEVGDQNQSLETLRRIAQLQPGQAGPLQRVAGVQARQKQYDRAAQTLRMAKDVAPNDHTVSRDLIVVYLSAGKPDDALKEAKAVQTAAPRSSAGWLLESQVHETQKRYDEAERVLRQGMKIEPASGLLAARLHGALVAGGKASEADGFVRKWLQDHPKDTTLRMQLGERELAAKNYKAAATHYQAVLAVDADHVIALNNLAWAAGQSNDPKAIGYAERAVKLAPNSAPVLDTLGTLLVEKGEAKRGLEYLQRAARLAPERADIRLNYAKGLQRAGRKDEARRELEALAATPNETPAKAEATALLKSQ